MKNTLRCFALVLILSGCQSRTSSENGANAISLTNNPYIISCDHLQELISQNISGYKIFDVRPSENYAKGHISGAHQVWRNDFNEDFEGLTSFRASKTKIEKVLSAAGVLPTDTLLLYDDRGNVNSARFWYVLNEHGWDKVKFLNGGITQWKHLGYPLSQQQTVSEPSGIRLVANSTHPISIGINEVANRTLHTRLLDSRTPEEFDGTIIKKGAAKGGRIPGAVRFNYSELLKNEENEKQTFLSPEEVKAKLEKIGLKPTDSVIVYCQSGARSSLLAFYFTRVLKFESVFNYDGSWIEWSHSDQLPYETGPQPPAN